MADTRLHQVIQQLCRAAGCATAASASDAQLLERFVAARDESAFELLVWRHQRLVMGVCQRVLRDRHEAEDAFQATFLALARKAGSIGRSAALGSWLYRVAYRVALRASSRGRQRTRHERQGLDLAATLTAAGQEPTAEVAGRDLEPLLDRALNGLPEKYRAPVVLCYLEGKSYEEAARQLGCPKGTVSTRLTFARDLLRKRLSQRGVCLSAATFVSVLAAQSASAALPAALVAGTAKAALPYASGTALVAGLVSPRVVALADGALRGLVLAKLKLAAAVAMTVGSVVLGLGAVAHRFQDAGPAAAAPLPTAVEAAEPPLDRVPDGLRGFQGTLVGRLVSRQPDRGALVLEVRQVKDVWRGNRAGDPQSAIGKTLPIDGVFGKFIDVLTVLKPGDGIQIEVRHVKGDGLTFVGENLQKVPLPVPAK